MRVLLLALSVHLACLAAPPTEQPISPVYGTRVVPQVAFGGGWQTSFTFLNLESSPQSLKLSFFDSAGKPWAVSLGGRPSPAAVVPLVLESRQVISLTTTDSGPLQQGWLLIEVSCCGDYAGFAVFRQRVAGRPDFESVVPLSDRDTSSFVLFDETESYSSGLAIVNPSAYSAASVTLAFRDMSGDRFHLDQIDLPPLNKEVFSLPSKYAQVRGRKGYIELTSPSYFSTFALRFNPTGAFTTTLTFEP